MSLETIRDEIKTIISGVPGVGIVHEYERWAVQKDKMLQLFTDSTGKINGCSIRRKARREKKVVVGSGSRVIHVFRIRFLMGLKDDSATGITFDNLVETIVKTVNDNNTLNGSCISTSPEFGQESGINGLQIELSEDRLFGSVLCHYAEGILAAVEDLQ